MFDADAGPLPKIKAGCSPCMSLLLFTQRGQYGEERYETKEMQTRVREIFSKLMANDPIWHVIDASKSMDDVTKAVTEVGLVEARKAMDQPLKTLWPHAEEGR